MPYMPTIMAGNLGLARCILHSKRYLEMTVLRRSSHGASTEKFTDDELKRAFTSPDGKPIIAGRPYLPGSSGKGLPRYLNGPRDDFPLVVDMAQVDSTEKLSEELVIKAKTILQENLLTYGAVLFQGLPLKTASDVASFMQYLRVRPMSYVGGNAVRDNVDAHVMTASREPPSYTIEPHNEMAYLKRYASHLAFFCVVPAALGCGGESVLTSNREFQNDIDQEVKEKFKRLGIRTSCFLPTKAEGEYLSWQEVFRTDDKETAERHMSQQGHSYKWHENGSVTYWYKLPPIRPHHTTGEEIWFNQAHMNATYFRANPIWSTSEIPDEKMPYHTYYGDGTPIETETLEHIRSIIWKNAVGLRMKEGELLFLDNMFVQHGRLGYVGDRRLLVSMIDDKL